MGSTQTGVKRMNWSQHYKYDYLTSVVYLAEI